MLFESEFRRPEGAAKLLEAIGSMGFPPVRIMEVCGTHTMAIAKSGLRQVLPPHVQLISGPGCPVCVTPAAAMDQVLELSSRPEVTLATYGDLMKVPGSIRGDDLRRRKALGADVRVVYSPMDALEIAKSEPHRQVVFLGVGFGTTAPGTALAVLEAKEQDMDNFTLLSLLKRTTPALHALMAREDIAIGALLCPGHVATILGANAFDFLPKDYGLPAVVAGFETGDLLYEIYSLLKQAGENNPHLENEYTRAASAQGTKAALAVMEQVLEPKADLWRGLGLIPDSGLALKEEFAHWDAAKRFGLSPVVQDTPTPCRCGDVICGLIEPTQCPLFGTACTPDEPTGPCMVSGEGACAAAYHYGGTPIEKNFSTGSGKF